MTVSQPATAPPVPSMASAPLPPMTFVPDRTRRDGSLSEPSCSGTAPLWMTCMALAKPLGNSGATCPMRSTLAKVMPVTLE